MIQNLQFFEVKQAKPQSPQNADAGSWAKYMQGKHIVKFYTTSGYTKKQMMWFCSDGSCRYSSNSSGYTQGGGPSFAFQNADIGTWTAQGSTNGTGVITIQWQDGTSSSSQIYIQGDELRINGERWLRDSNQFCN